jgi:methoxymalonate biosynthesis acyl carrier protein
MQANENAKLISSFLLRHIGKDCIGLDEDIFAAGYVNSLFALELITFVEKTFVICVEDQDLDLANFRTITAIDRFVQQKRNVRQQ